MSPLTSGTCLTNHHSRLPHSLQYLIGLLPQRVSVGTDRKHAEGKVTSPFGLNELSGNAARMLTLQYMRCVSNPMPTGCFHCSQFINTETAVSPSDIT